MLPLSAAKGTEKKVSAHSTRTLLEKAEALGSNGKFSEAISVYNVAIRQEPHNPKIWLGLGVAYEMLNQTRKAEEHYRRALELDPAEYRAMEGLAGILERSGDRWEEAITWYQEALKLDPRRVWQENLRVWIAILESRRRPATDFAVGCWHLGNKQRIAGDLQAAEQSFSRAIVLDPDVFQGWYCRGLVRLEMNKVNEAIQDFNKTVHLAPTFAPGFLHLALAMEKIGEKQEASRCVKRAVELDSQDPEALFHLARFIASEGDLVRARELLTKALQMKPKPELREQMRTRLENLVTSAQTQKNHPGGKPRRQPPW